LFLKIGCREATDFFVPLEWSKNLKVETDFCATYISCYGIFLLLLQEIIITMDIKDYRISPWQWVAFIIVAAGLRILTGSFWMALGIFMLLLLVDFFIVQWDKKRRDEYESIFTQYDREKEKENEQENVEESANDDKQENE
jgi:hypothetical protein